MFDHPSRDVFKEAVHSNFDSRIGKRCQTKRGKTCKSFEIKFHQTLSKSWLHLQNLWGSQSYRSFHPSDKEIIGWIVIKVPSKILVEEIITRRLQIHQRIIIGV